MDAIGTPKGYSAGSCQGGLIPNSAWGFLRGALHESVNGRAWHRNADLLLKVSGSSSGMEQDQRVAGTALGRAPKAVTGWLRADSPLAQKCRIPSGTFVSRSLVFIYILASFVHKKRCKAGWFLAAGRCRVGGY